jgi:hypothetical protein
VQFHRSSSKPICCADAATRFATVNDRTVEMLLSRQAGEVSEYYRKARSCLLTPRRGAVVADSTGSGLSYCK